jgi:hypothetical protein
MRDARDNIFWATIMKSNVYLGFRGLLHLPLDRDTPYLSFQLTLLLWLILIRMCVFVTLWVGKGGGGGGFNQFTSRL